MKFSATKGDIKERNQKKTFGEYDEYVSVITYDYKHLY